MSVAWQGIYPAVTSKFTAESGLDLEEMRRCFTLQIDCGVDGLIVCGSLGEASTPDLAEKNDIAKAVCDGRPVLFTISEGATRNAQEAARRAQSLGADGLMVLPGLPYKSDPRETIAHFRSVAAATDLPFMVYNNPVAYGVDITPEMLVAMSSEPQFVAIKESSDDARRVSDIINLTGDRYSIFTGVDNLALESMAMGAVGWVAGLVVAFPRETVAIWRLHRAGRHEKARQIYRWFRPILDVDVSTKLVQIIKLVELLVIGSNDRCRPPRLPLAGSERAAITAAVAAALKSRPNIDSAITWLQHRVRMP